MKKIIYFTAIFISINLSAQTNYLGFIDKYPIELLTNIRTSGNSYGVYVYSEKDEPIKLEGKLEQQKLIFFEKDTKGNKTSSLIFDNFISYKETINGIWKDLKTEKELNIILYKKESTSDGIIQQESIDDKYFRIIVDSEIVSQIKIFQKKTDKLLQKFDVDCRNSNMYCISTGDFNFDGFQDFSIFESSYAGPNTSSLYFLYNPKTKKFFESGFVGTSLEFDKKRKIITETNQCCAGSSIINADYKVVKNKMILIKEHCFKWNEKKQALVEQKPSKCH